MRAPRACVLSVCRVTKDVVIDGVSIIVGRTSTFLEEKQKTMKDAQGWEIIGGELPVYTWTHHRAYMVGPPSCVHTVLARGD